ncbi:MAG TPA: glycosyltransferase family 4 protein, partial [Symbiobacteriaceae bacterium]|nr:glycosyltransferase family 4 protein [Symbiobacteriaceae bacterium]
MRICLVCTEKNTVPPIRGGAIQTYIDGVLPYLSQVHDTTVICRSDPALPEREERQGLRFVRVPGGDPAVYCPAVTRVLANPAEPPFDRVIIYNRPAYVPALARACRGAAILLSMHNDMFGYDRLPPGVARRILTQADAVITISDYVGRVIDGLHPGFAHKLHTIRSGVDLDRFRPAWQAGPGARQAMRQRLGIPGHAPVVLHVSRLSPKKGNHLVIDAMARVRTQFPDAQLLLVGSSRYGSDLLDAYGEMVHRKACGLLGNAVHFTGFVPPARVGELFSAGDLFVCASQWEEPLARVHYEAMATGLPIVTTGRGGNTEVMEEGGNGL